MFIFNKTGLLVNSCFILKRLGIRLEQLPLCSDFLFSDKERDKSVFSDYFFN